MTERPILFSGPMVRAILAGTKTETRRVVKPGLAAALTYLDCDDHDCVSGWHDDGHSGPGVYAWCSTYPDEGAEFCPCPYGVPGDRLWVRETWATWSYLDKTKPSDLTPGQSLSYHATPGLLAGRWRPSIHMPRWASRLTLVVQSVRVERLHDIDDAGARAEGVADREAFRELWCDINGAESWDSNPWVWVVGFERVQA